MALQADNQTPPSTDEKIVSNDYIIKFDGVELTRQYRQQQASGDPVDKDDTQCPFSFGTRGVPFLRGRNTAYKVERSDGD